jgi:hypothetical protein
MAPGINPKAGRVAYNLTAPEENAVAAESWTEPRMAAPAAAMKATAIHARMRLRICYFLRLYKSNAMGLKKFRFVE